MNDAAESLTIDEIIARIHAEASRRRGDPGIAVPPAASSMPSEGHIGAAATPADWTARRRFALTEFLELTDGGFIHAAYGAALGRAPDPDGLRHFLGALSGGERSRVDVLLALQRSPEGQAHGSVFEGMPTPSLTMQLGQLPLVGRPLRWLAALLRLRRYVAELQRLSAAHATLERRFNRMEANLIARDRTQQRDTKG